MAYADQQMSGNKIIAIIIVALIHVALGYALITGLAYNAVKKAIERVTTVDIEEEVPHLWALHEHLTVWLQKYKAAIRMPSTCLVYLAPHENLPFPSEVDEELEDLVASVSEQRPRRIVRVRRGRSMNR